MPIHISSSDCGQVVFEPLGSGEIATRLIVNAPALKLSEAQLRELMTIARGWRQRFHELVGRANADQLIIQRELAQRHPARETIEAAISRRARALITIESEFVDRWLRVWETISDEQYAALMDLYEDELRQLPPWVEESRRVAEEDVQRQRRLSTARLLDVKRSEDLSAQPVG
jgi:hypothetical protein